MDRRMFLKALGVSVPLIAIKPDEVVAEDTSTLKEATMTELNCIWPDIYRKTGYVVKISNIYDYGWHAKYDKNKNRKRASYNFAKNIQIGKGCYRVLYTICGEPDEMRTETDENLLTKCTVYGLKYPEKSDWHVYLVYVFAKGSVVGVSFLRC